MTKLHVWPPKRDDDWPYCYTPDTTDGMAITLTAMKLHPEDPLNAPLDEIEVKRTGGGVLCRRKKEATHGGQIRQHNRDDDTGGGGSGGVRVAGRAGTGEVTG